MLQIIMQIIVFLHVFVITNFPSKLFSYDYLYNILDHVMKRFIKAYFVKILNYLKIIQYFIFYCTDVLTYFFTIFLFDLVYFIFHLDHFRICVYLSINYYFFNLILIYYFIFLYYLYYLYLLYKLNTISPFLLII